MGRRGASIIEVMIAGAVLLIALVGVVALFRRGVAAEREGAVVAFAASRAEQVVTEYEALGFAALAAAAGVDCGTVTDSLGREYTCQVDIVDVPVAAGFPSFEVRVVVTASPQGPFLPATQTMAWGVASQNPAAAPPGGGP